MNSTAKSIVIVVHYFPPMNSAGAKRMEAMAKYFAREGRKVTVLTTAKSDREGPLTEVVPQGIELIELDALGRRRPVVSASLPPAPDPATSVGPSRSRWFRNRVMDWFGQIPDPRLPFSASLLSPWLDSAAERALRECDVVIASCPPWPTLLAGVWARARFGARLVLDYRDHFSECHEMRGGQVAKFLERVIDRQLASRAAIVVVVSDPMARYYGQWSRRTAVILNGYDPDVLSAVKASTAWQARGPEHAQILRYMGTITPDRVPRNMVSAIAGLAREGRLSPRDAKFEYYGDCEVLREYLAGTYPEAAPFFEFSGPKPYRTALKLAAEADYLLFSETSVRDSLSAQGILTTKLFEYLALGRPIVADISPSTLAGAMIVKAGAQHLVADTPQVFRDWLLSPGWRHPPESIESPVVAQLSRAAQAKEYLALLDQLCATQQR